MVLFLRLSNLQPIHGRSIVPMVVPKLQTHLVHKKNEKSIDWKFKSRDLAAQEPDLWALDNDDKILYSTKPLCLSTQSEISLGNNKCMALANLSPSADKDAETAFTSKHTEFGTDNCATHHICSDYNLFIKSTYKLIESIGVQGIAGRALAKGIGTVVFTVTDDNGARSTITLENVIHLPEASKT